jgi:hypothetical protein
MLARLATEPTELVEMAPQMPTASEKPMELMQQVQLVLLA